MSLYMLDTDMASYLIKGNRPEVSAAFSIKFPDVCISSITYAELNYGAMKRKNLSLIKKVHVFCELVECMDWNAKAAVNYAKIRAELEANGSSIGSMDMLTAASALATGAILVTNNTAHFSRIKQLKLDNWCKDLA